MIRLIGSVLIGGLIVLLASSNSHVVETRLGPLVMLSPHFVVLGITFFLGFATGIVAVMANVLKWRKQKSSASRSIVVKR